MERGVYMKHRILIMTCCLFVGVVSLAAVAYAATKPVVFVEPDAGSAPVLAFIQSAKKSLDVVDFHLDSFPIEQALVSAHAHGVRVRVLLNLATATQPAPDNQPTYNYLSAHGVDIEWGSPNVAYTHEKSMVEDGKQALILTGNLVPWDLAHSRDIGFIDKDAADVSAIESGFVIDWNREASTPSAGSHLVWSPGANTSLIALINDAKHSLQIYNEELSDWQIIDALSAAAKRGVSVQLIMTYQASWKSAFEALKSAGAGIRTFDSAAPIYIHAKVIVADNSQVFLGSQNFSYTSLKKNRELGVIVTTKSVRQAVQKVFAADWSKATAF
jgi:phosphatidylserine/phosphatidylglycerophosphate/cardiolipin synthase-like enzyme